MLTATGRSMVILAAVLIAGGLVLGYPEIIAIGLACVVALVVAVGWMSIRADIIATRELTPARVSEGDPSSARLTVTNRRRKRGPPIMAQEKVGAERIAIAIPSLAANAAHIAEYRLPTDHRGIFGVGPLTIGQSDPLQLMSFGRSFSSRSTLWVYPRIHELHGVLTTHTTDVEGPTSSSAAQGGVAFHSLREWVWGDDHRQIHWRSTARTGILQVRQMVTPDESRVLILLDTSVDPYRADSFEDAVRVAASLAHVASLERFPVTVRTTGGAAATVHETGPGLHAVMDLFAAVRTDRSHPGLAASTQLIPDQPNLTVLIVTGRASRENIAMAGVVRARLRLVALAQIGEPDGRPAAAPAGVFGVSAANSEDFCAIWNRLVRR